MLTLDGRFNTFEFHEYSNGFLFGCVGNLERKHGERFAAIVRTYFVDETFFYVAILLAFFFRFA